MRSATPAFTEGLIIDLPIYRMPKSFLRGRVRERCLSKPRARLWDIHHWYANAPSTASGFSVGMDRWSRSVYYRSPHPEDPASGEMRMMETEGSSFCKNECFDWLCGWAKVTPGQTVPSSPSPGVARPCAILLLQFKWLEMAVCASVVPILAH